MTLLEDVRALNAEVGKLAQKVEDSNELAKLHEEQISGKGGLQASMERLAEEVEKWREVSKEEARDVRKAIRNLGFTVAGSVAGVFIVQQVLGG